MRKIIVSMNVTLDGFMAGTNCELDWHFRSWTNEMAESACEQLSEVDTILFGRVTFSAMAKYWTAKTVHQSFAREDIDFAEMMNNYNKVVFSKTLSKVEGWKNARLAKRNMIEEVNVLKQMPGKGMIIYGSGEIVSALMQKNLIDEFRIWVHPVVIGRGRPLFQDHPDSFRMHLSKVKAFSSGVVMLFYKCTSKIY